MNLFSDLIEALIEKFFAKCHICNKRQPLFSRFRGWKKGRRPAYVYCPQHAHRRADFERSLDVNDVGEMFLKKDIRGLAKALRDKNPKIREAAATHLFMLGDLFKRHKAIMPFIAALKDENAEVRIDALKNLATALKAENSLATELKAENLTVRLAMRPSHVTHTVASALRDENEDVRVAATWVFIQLCDVRAIKPLIDALQDKSVLVRFGAVTALSKLEDSRVIHSLIASFHAALDDVDDILGEHILNELEKLMPHEEFEELSEQFRNKFAL